MDDFAAALKRLELPGRWHRNEDVSAWIIEDLEKACKAEKLQEGPLTRSKRKKTKRKKMLPPYTPPTWDPKPLNCADCYHTDEEHKELEKTMGATIAVSLDRGKALLGKGHVFAPSFEEFLPPPRYLIGLSPVELQRLKQADMFNRIYNDPAKLGRVCACLLPGCCKFMLSNRFLHTMVMAEAMRELYERDTDADKYKPEMSYKAACFLSECEHEIMGFSKNDGLDYTVPY